MESKIMMLLPDSTGVQTPEVPKLLSNVTPEAFEEGAPVVHDGGMGGGVYEFMMENVIFHSHSLAPSLTVKTTTEPFAGCVGVPVTLPVEEFRLKPAGRIPLRTVNVTGPFVKKAESGWGA